VPDASAAPARETTNLLDFRGTSRSPLGPARRETAVPRQIEPEEWRRFRGYVGEIFAALGMDLDAPGTKDTPERFLQALLDSTSGYEGDRKLLTAFPAESRSAAGAALGQIVEGPIGFSALCEHHALPSSASGTSATSPGSRSSGSPSSRGSSVSSRAASRCRSAWASRSPTRWSS
jgi:GTP cyclohydrolase IA